LLTSDLKMIWNRIWRAKNKVYMFVNVYKYKSIFVGVRLEDDSKWNLASWKQGYKLIENFCKTFNLVKIFVKLSTLRKFLKTTLWNSILWLDAKERVRRKGWKSNQGSLNLRKNYWAFNAFWKKMQGV